MILTKSTPQEIASAATGQMNYTVINKEKMPPDFAAAAAAAALIQTVEDVFAIGARVPNPGVRWRTTDLILLMYSDLTRCPRGLLEMPLAPSQRLLLLYFPIESI